MDEEAKSPVRQKPDGGPESCDVRLAKAGLDGIPAAGHSAYTIWVGLSEPLNHPHLTNMAPKRLLVVFDFDW